MLPAREGTQAGQKKLAGAEYLLSLTQMDSDDPFTKIASEQDKRNANLGGADDYGQSSESDHRLRLVAEEFRKRLTADEERVMLLIMHPDFTHLPQAVKAEALGAVDLMSQKAILNSLKEKSQAIGTEFNLTDENCNTALKLAANAISRESEVWS